MKLKKLENGYTINHKTIIDNKKTYIKTIISSEEEEIINEFVKTIVTIRNVQKYNPQFFVFNRREFMSFLLSRFVLFNTQQDVIPIKKYDIEDIREKLGNYNDEEIVFKYFGYDKSDEVFIFDELKKDKEEMINFFKTALNNIVNLTKITSKIINNTCPSNYLPRVIVTLEVEPILDKMEEFKNTFKYLKDEEDSKIIRYMKNNFAFSKILAISVCHLSDELNEVPEEQEE